MNLYLVREKSDSPIEYDVIIGLVGAARSLKQARELLQPMVINGSDPEYIGKAKVGEYDNGEVIMKDINEG